ncbi:hypothetical protein DM02DRAFT_97011 [Periconia macrospinosa]|uniref:Uncharacterized protein n=1 Tax=Periconia macrospinosa TaxID=97972 RepID=A0A2V1E7Z1_9PLEO|nr:hypothetical protein DM02DRAFT_97011 [Periconia macrospinosa]
MKHPLDKRPGVVSGQAHCVSTPASGHRHATGDLTLSNRAEWVCHCVKLLVRNVGLKAADVVVVVVLFLPVLTRRYCLPLTSAPSTSVCTKLYNNQNKTHSSPSLTHITIMSDPYNQYNQHYQQYPPNQYGSPAPSHQGYGGPPPQQGYDQGYNQQQQYPPPQQGGSYYGGEQHQQQPQQQQQYPGYGPPAQGGFQHGQSTAPHDQYNQQG